MNRYGLLGMLCGVAIVAATVVSAFVWLQSDTDKGELACVAMLAKTGTGSEDPIPVCKHRLPAMLLMDYTFTDKSSVQNGDHLTCRLIQHNEWRFEWERRHKGFYNDWSYSYDNCIVGRSA